MPPVDLAAMADLALGAAQKPAWVKPPDTVLGPPVSAESQAGQYHPFVNVVETKLTPLTQSARAAALSARLAWVQNRKGAAESALQAIGLAPGLPSTLALTQVTKAQASGTADKRFTWPLKKTKKSFRVKDLWFRLKVGHTEAVNFGEVVSTDHAFAALTDSTVIGNAAAQAISAASLLLQMRCLADTYARWEMAAQLTRALVGVQLAKPELSTAEMLARILTYGRIEGDLAVPPEDDSLEGSDSGSDASHIPLPSGRSYFLPALSYPNTTKPAAYLYCVTDLLQTSDITLPPPTGTITLSQSATRKSVADGHFTLALGGLDILWNTDFQKAAEGPGFTYNGVFSWAALNRQIPANVTMAAAYAQAQADYTTRISLLTEQLKGPTSSRAARISALDQSSYALLPEHSYSGAGANYLALVLSEGVRYMNRLTYGPTRFGQGTARLPEIIVYVLFHTGGNSKGLLASAAGNALRSSSVSSYAQALRNALNAAGLSTDAQTVLVNVRKTTTTGKSVSVATAGWDTIAPVLGDPSVVKALAEYIRYEDDTVWTSWVKDGSGAYSALSPRGNCIGYSQLYDYLLDQITGSASSTDQATDPPS